VSLHPGGYAHGPQPSAIEASLGAEYFDELAVMVDTFKPLDLGEAALAAEDPGYAWTWAGRGPGQGEAGRGPGQGEAGRGPGQGEDGDGGPAVFSNS
jgi:homogentisate 1,2-dioxygenase